MNVHSSGLIYLTNSFYSETMEIGDFILENQGRTDIVIAAATRPYMAVEEIKFLSGIFYPNPLETQSILQIETEIRDATLIISNVFGQTVRRIDKLNGNQFIIDRGNLTSGVYFLKIKNNNKQVASIKMINH